MAKEYIEREAAVEEANGFPFTMSMCLSEQECVGMQRAQAIIAKRIIALPAADVRPVVHAHWVDVRQEGVCAWTAECSNCWTRNDIPPVELAHYCPNCGAQMDVDMRKVQDG